MTQSMFKRDPDCIAQREYVNVPAWHRAGHTGRGINVFCDDADKTHAESVADIVQTILPDANVYYGNIGSRPEGGQIKLFCTAKNINVQSMEINEFIRRYNISLINNSTGRQADTSGNPTATQLALKEVLDRHNIIMTGAAGNDNEGHITCPWCNVAMMVNSARLKNGRPIHAPSSIGNKIDFAMFTGFQPGTSFASPFLLGLIGLLRCRFGRELTQAQAYDYLRSHAVDLRDEGRDNCTGWGLPVMGDPDEDYFKEDNMVVTFKIGSAVMDVDGKHTIMDEVPQYNQRGDRMMVPVKYVAEAFGCRTEWDEATRTAKFIKRRGRDLDD